MQTTHPRGRFTGLVMATLALTICCACPAAAQNTTRPIKLIVPFAVGGSTDIMARAVANSLANVLGQPVLVENRSGATGGVASSVVSRADPDGTTLLFTNVSATSIAPALTKNAPEDPLKDITPIGLVARSPMVLVANPSTNVKDVQGLIGLARSSPGKLEYASAGVGSFGHLGTEMFSEAAGVKLLHVPYQGQAPSINALLTGEVKVSITSPSSALLELAKSGRLLLLGQTYLELSALVPDTPPIAKTVTGFEMVLWTGIVGPPKMSDATVQRLSDALQKVLSDKGLAQKFENSGSDVAFNTPQQFQQLIVLETARYRKAVKIANLKND